jgi:hypothetical protein
MNTMLNTPVVISGAPDANAVVQMTGLRKMGIVEELPECPIHLEEPMPQGNLQALTVKKHIAIGGDPDTCTGLAGQNTCHDNDATGGDIIGFVLKEPIIGREEDLVKLERSVSWGMDDTCTGVEGKYECHDTDDNTLLGYIFGPEVPLNRRPGTVALTVKSVADLCGTLAQFLYQANLMTEDEIQDPAAVKARARRELEEKKGKKPEELDAMDEAAMLTFLKDDSNEWGVTCTIHDMCTDLEGQNPCHMPKGEGPIETVIGYIIGADKDTQEPSNSWDSCAATLRCPVVYSVPVAAQLVDITKKEAVSPEGNSICYGLSTDNICGESESPTGGDDVGSVFVEPLEGYPMKEVTAGMLHDPPDDANTKVLGYAFTEKQQGTKKKGGVYIVTPSFKLMYATCGSFEKKALKWVFQMKMEYGEEAAEQGDIRASFMSLDQGIYETADKDDQTVHHMFQVGKVLLPGKDGWSTVKFHKKFKSPPAVLCTVQTYNTAKMVKCRAKPASDGEVELALETRDGVGSAEDEWVGWMAFEPSSGTIGGLKYVAENVDGVDDEGSEEEYDVHTPVPQVFGAVSSDHSTKPAHVSLNKITRKKLKVAVKNDALDDSSHAAEKVALLVFQGGTDQPSVVRGWLEQRVTYQWHAGLFGDSCSKVCGTGEKTREVKCTSSVGTDDLPYTVVTDVMCGEHEKPAEKMECGGPCAWFISAWEACDAGERGVHGKEKRTVQCHTGANAEGTKVLDSDCEDDGMTKPGTEKECCVPKTQMDFPDTHQCGKVSNGCEGDFAGEIDYGTCGNNWVCKDHECDCEAKPITTSGQMIQKANSYGGGFDFMCPDAHVMLGVEATHSDKFEDREWSFTCAALDAPAFLSGCEKFSFCGKKETDSFSCPSNFALVGLSAQPPKDNDRAMEWTCCRVEGVFEEAKSGDSGMTEEQKKFTFTLEAEPGKPSPMIMGVDSEFDSGKVDRKFKFSWKSYTSKAHCESCTQEPVTVNTTADFAVGTNGYLNEHRRDLDFKCPDGEVITGLKSEYIEKSGLWDFKWNAKCGKVKGAKLGSCSKAVPKSCSALSADAETTPVEASWHLECEKHGALTEVKSVFEALSMTSGDRKFEFTCCELEGIGGYKDYAAGYHFPSGDEKLWTYNAGANTAITGVSSGSVAGKQRSFTFYGSTFAGKKECSTEWSPR